MGLGAKKVEKQWSRAVASNSSLTFGTNVANKYDPFATNLRILFLKIDFQMSKTSKTYTVGHFCFIKPICHIQTVIRHVWQVTSQLTGI